MPSWVVYIVRCRDGSLYTGISNDLARRLAAHNGGTGARYTRGRGPVILVHLERRRSRGAAQRREAAIKALARTEKLALLAAQSPAAASALSRMST
jgi:predicted GIY-YIG superfamily endonuclease